MVTAYAPSSQGAVADVARSVLERRRSILQAKDTLDIVDWGESNYWIPNPLRLIRLMPYQKGLLRIAFTRLAETGHYPYSLFLFCGPKKAGKALALDTRVPTPAGWSTMEALQVGDEVFSEKGEVCRVTWVSEIMRDRPCYEVCFTDGATVVADAEHLWRVHTFGERGCEDESWTRTTEQLAGSLCWGRGWNHSVPVTGPLCLPERNDLPVPPYTLGAWLGDGHTDGARISCFDAEIIEHIQAEGVTVHPNSHPGLFGLRGLTVMLREAGVLGNKHIPDLYLRASADQRLSLLQGLMDTDGCIAPLSRPKNHHGCCELTFTCRPLAETAVVLLRSLGFKPSMAESRARLYGRDCGPRYRIGFTAFVDLPVFRLRRKWEQLPARASRQMKRLRSCSRHITAINPVPSVPVRCIAVDSPSHLYLVTEHLIPTHNSTVMGVPVRYVAETQTELGEVNTVGHDLKQARSRSFKFARQSIMLTPGYRRRQGHSGEGVLPERWDVQKGQMTCLTTGTVVEALGIDPEGEAGGNPDLTVFTELWGARHEDEVRMWEEMTPPPTKLDSMRIVETYAGFTGVSVLLEELYTKGKQGRQMLNEEFARRSHREKDGERYEDFLHAFEELDGDPTGETPIWVNEAAGMLMYWDSGVEARRMPWLRGAEGAAYYAEQEAQVTPAQFSRQHLNEWVGAEGEYVPITLYDVRMEELPPFDPHVMGKGQPGEERVVLSADAAVSKDCFGIVAVTRHPDPARRADSVALRAARKWDPKDSGGVIDFRGPEAFIRTLCQGGCVMGHPQYGDWIDPECWACREKALSPPYMVLQLTYDPYQLADMMQRLSRDRVVWCKPFLQTKERLIADTQLHDLITQGRFAHPGIRVCNVCGDRGCQRHEDYRLVPEFPAMREHMLNANMKLQPNEDSKMRIIKRAESAKIDLVVALSQGARQALRLQL